MTTMMNANVILHSTIIQQRSAQLAMTMTPSRIRVKERQYARVPKIFFICSYCIYLIAIFHGDMICKCHAATSSASSTTTTTTMSSSLSSLMSNMIELQLELDYYDDVTDDDKIQHQQELLPSTLQIIQLQALLHSKEIMNSKRERLTSFEKRNQLNNLEMWSQLRGGGVEGDNNEVNTTDDGNSEKEMDETDETEQETDKEEHDNEEESNDKNDDGEEEAAAEETIPFLTTMTSFFKPSKSTTAAATTKTTTLLLEKVYMTTEKAKSFLTTTTSSSSFSTVFRMNMEAKDYDSDDEEEEEEELYDSGSEEEDDDEDVGIVMMNKKTTLSPPSVQKQGRGGGGIMTMSASDDEQEEEEDDLKDAKKKDVETKKEKNTTVVDVTVMTTSTLEENGEKEEKDFQDKKEEKKEITNESSKRQTTKVADADADVVAVKGIKQANVTKELEKTVKPRQQQQKKKTKKVEEAGEKDDISTTTTKSTKEEVNANDIIKKEAKKKEKSTMHPTTGSKDKVTNEKNTTRVTSRTTPKQKNVSNTTSNVKKSVAKEEVLGNVGNVTLTKEEEVIETNIQEEKEMALVEVTATSYISSGYWDTIDKIATLGLSAHHPTLKISRQLRSARKAAAKMTGLHGILSGKGRGWGGDNNILSTFPHSDHQPPLNEEDIGIIRNRIAAIEVAKGKVRSNRSPLVEEPVEGQTTPRGRVQRPRRRGWGRILPRRRNNNQGAAFVGGPLVTTTPTATTGSSDVNFVDQSSLEEEIEKARMAAAAVEEELRRQKRVEEIDRLIVHGQEELLELQCEKDALQRRPNPLFNYTTKGSPPASEEEEKEEEATEYPDTTRTTRVFNFPPQEVVDEYIDTLIGTGRLVRLNHTHLWKSGAGDEYDDDEDESIGDDLLTPSADARKLYENVDKMAEKVKKRTTKRNGNSSNDGGYSGGNGGGGSWLLRQTMMTGTSLGEKIGEATETAAYKAVCSAVMSVLARSISAIHGINVMTHSDIRLFLEQSPDLPPLGKDVFPHGVNGDDYAREAIEKAIIKGATKRKKKHSRSKHHIHSNSRHHGHDLTEEAFIQRDAVVETLISHCQISAPLLKLFPLAWQRAMLGNIITLIAAVVSDFAEGIQIQILGHQLSFSFKPITESDMIQHIGLGGFRFNHRRARPEEFEAAVRATADDISEELQFLDRWHERAMGGGYLKLQIGNLIARVVLTLVDEVLSGARMDLWSAQAGGPRVVAGLEYRTQRDKESDTGLPQ